MGSGLAGICTGLEGIFKLYFEGRKFLSQVLHFPAQLVYLCLNW
jgi:hypothetical protein